MDGWRDIPNFRAKGSPASRLLQSEVAAKEKPAFRRVFHAACKTL
jgi:hypothetical protein